jgi:predicted secreted protein
MKTFLRAFLLLCALSATALAGDYANLNFIGFSESGEYLAFEEWGEGDPGGWYSNIYYVNVVKNSYAIAPTKILDEEGNTSLNAVRKRAALIAAKNLRKLKIVRGNNGQMVLAHLLTDRSYDNGGAEVIRFNGYFNPNSPNYDEYYELSINHILTNDPKCRETGFETNRLELILKDNTSHGGPRPPQILQKDKTLPESRNCPNAYAVELVYMYGAKIAVFLNVFSRGFEGPNMRYMVVTGELEYEPFGYDYFKK